MNRIVGMVFVAIIVIVMANVISTLNVTSATNYLTGQGFTVFAGTVTDDTVSSTLTVCASDANDTTRCDSAGDGTDDDVQIQAAIDALTEGTVFLSEGDFSLGASVTMAASVSLRGQGIDKTTLTVANSADVTAITASSINDFSISGFTIDGNKANQTDATIDGIRITSSNDWTVDSIEVIDCEDDGFDTNNTNNGRITRSVVNACNGAGISTDEFDTGYIGDFRALATQDGVLMDGARDVILDNLIITSPTQFGIRLWNNAGGSGRDAIRVQVNAPIITSSGDDAIRIEDTQQAQINNAIISLAGDNGIIITTGASEITINGGVIDNSDAHGVLINGVPNNKILALTSSNNGQDTTGNGVHITGAGAVDNIVMGSLFFDNVGGFAIRETGSADFTIAVGNNGRDETEGTPITIPGAGSVKANNIE